MHARKHLLVPPDHRDNDGAPKGIELVRLHLKGILHLAQRPVTCFLGQEGQIPTDLAKLKSTVHLLGRTVSSLEKRLRVCRDHFCNGSHGVTPFSVMDT